MIWFNNMLSRLCGLNPRTFPSGDWFMQIRLCVRRKCQHYWEDITVVLGGFVSTEDLLVFSGGLMVFDCSHLVLWRFEAGIPSTQRITWERRKEREWSEGLGYRLFGGIGKIRARKVLPHAQTCLNRNSDALTRCPKPMPSTRTPLFVLYEYSFGADWTAAYDRAIWSPPLITCWGGGNLTYKQNCYLLPPIDHNFPPLGLNYTPFRPPVTAYKTTTSTPIHNTAQQPEFTTGGISRTSK